MLSHRLENSTRWVFSLFVTSWLYLQSGSLLAWAEKLHTVRFDRKFKVIHHDLLQRPTPRPLSVVRRPLWARKRAIHLSYRTQLHLLQRHLLRSRGRERTRVLAQQFHLGQYLVWSIVRHALCMAQSGPSVASDHLLQQVRRWTQKTPQVLGVKRQKLLQLFSTKQSLLLGFLSMKSRRTFAQGLWLFLRGLQQQKRLLSFPYDAWVSTFLWKGFLFEAAETLWVYRELLRTTQRPSLLKRSFLKIVFFSRPVNSFFKASRSVRLHSKLSVPVPKQMEKQLRREFAASYSQMQRAFFLSPSSLKSWGRWKKRWTQQAHQLKRSRRSFKRYIFLSLIKQHQKDAVACHHEFGFWRLLCDPRQIGAIEYLFHSTCSGHQP